MKLTTTDNLLLSALLPSAASSARLRHLLTHHRSEIDWNLAIRRADLHGITPLLRFNLKNNHLLETLPAEAREALDTATHLWAARQLAYASEVVRLVRALDATQITAIPLKGMALILGGYYPQAGLRTAADMDLLIRPEQIAGAERVAHECGYQAKDHPAALPGTMLLPPRANHRLPVEMNHTEARRGPGGLMLELHRRAFHYARGARDFGFAEMIGRTVPQASESGFELRLPAAEDLCLHLVHHVLVDLRSTHLILRTLADLHFITQREPQALHKLKERAAEIGLTSAAQAAIELLVLIREGTLEELAQAAHETQTATLLEAALQESPGTMALTAWLFEYFDVKQTLRGGLRSLLAIAFTSREHLVRDFGAPSAGRAYFYYPRRLLDLLGKFDWQSLHPAMLRRLLRLRKIGRPQTTGR